MDVKSDKTFEEIVERLAALFKLKPRPGDQDYEEPIEINPPSAAAATSNVPQSPVCFPKNKK